MQFYDDVVKQMVSVAIDRYGYYHNKHEFESVLREEIWEVSKEVKKLNKQHKKLFSKINKNKETSKQEQKLQKFARGTIFEALQVLAVLEKNKISKQKLANQNSFNEQMNKINEI